RRSGATADAGREVVVGGAPHDAEALRSRARRRAIRGAHRHGLCKQRARRGIPWRITPKGPPPPPPSLPLPAVPLLRRLRGSAAPIPFLCLPLLLPLPGYVPDLPARLSGSPAHPAGRLLCRRVLPPRG